MSNFAGHLPVRYYLLRQSLLYQGSTDEHKSVQNLRPLNRPDVLGPASLLIPGFESNSPIFAHSHHETIIKFCTGSLVSIKITFIKWIFWKKICCLTHRSVKLKLKNVTVKRFLKLIGQWHQPMRTVLFGWGPIRERSGEIILKPT